MKKIVKNQKIIILFIFIVLISTTTVGFALYGQLLELNGNVSLEPDGQLEIVDIELGETSNVLRHEIPTIDQNNNISFNITFGGDEEEFYAVYNVEVINKSSYAYTFNEFNFNPIINSSGGGTATLKLEIEGIENNEIINPKEKRVIKLILRLEPSDKNQSYDVNVDTNIETKKQESGTLLVTSSIINNDLQESKRGSFKVKLINSYDTPLEAEIISINRNFKIVDANGNNVSVITIPANSEQEYTYYLSTTEDSIFKEDTSNTSIYIKTSKGNLNAGTFSLKVDISEEKDETIPEIGEVNLKMLYDLNQAKVTFTRLDSGGTDIVNYGIRLFDANTDTYVKTYNTNSSITEMTLTDIPAGTYYVLVYGEDEAGNTGSVYINDASQDNIHCRKSNTVIMRWTFNVINDLNNLTSNGSATVNIGETYKATLTSSRNNYTVPNSVTISMNGTDLTTSDYTYSNGVITIPNVTGDITITAQATYNGCLIKGTKIKTIDGYKNIEDIDYNDLLVTWNYETGSTIYEYPIWIENESKTDSYRMIKFDDGSELKVYGYHGVFNVELNRFVSVDNNQEFNIGTKIYKLDKNNNLIETKVVEMYMVEEEITYYHIVSSRYYNIIANDILTTDGTVMLSNLYGFEENVKWPSVRNYLLSDESNLYSEEELNILPKHMYIGLRAKEGKILSNYGLSLDLFKFYLLENQLNDNMWKKPNTNINGKNIWKVSTTIDTNVVNNEILEEGSYYTLPEFDHDSDYKTWYSSADGKIYNPGDQVPIYFGTNFEAKK